MRACQCVRPSGGRHHPSGGDSGPCCHAGEPGPRLCLRRCQIGPRPTPDEYIRSRPIDAGDNRARSLARAQLEALITIGLLTDAGVGGPRRTRGAAVPSAFTVRSSPRRSSTPPGPRIHPHRAGDLGRGHLAEVLARPGVRPDSGRASAAGRLPSRASIWGVLAAPWPMVTASYLLLLALVQARLAGASALTAATSA
jgi:hypothetical protein